ncbi:MAG TPA: anti-sigma factor [Aeromicrobium sp.]|nr:anti-sigma factor [Aeromicrobium sp.]
MSDLHSLSAAYALDALDDIERARFEKHLAACGECREEVAGLSEAASQLSHPLATLPPPDLRDRVLADAARVRPLAPRTAVTASRRIPRLVAAAAVVIGLAGGATAVIWQTGQQAQQVQVTLADRIRNADDAQTWTRSLPSGARATLVRSESVGKAVIRTSGLRPAPAGKVYQLWLQEPTGLVSAGLFSAGDSEVVLRGDAAQALGAGLTVEPSGGSPAPTTTPLVFVDFQKG